MKALIEIECDTIQDFLNHLEKIKEDTIKQCENKLLKFDEDEVPDHILLNDDNCYGFHEVQISN